MNKPKRKAKIPKSAPLDTIETSMIIPSSVLTSLLIRLTCLCFLYCVILTFCFQTLLVVLAFLRNIYTHIPIGRVCPFEDNKFSFK